jgi:hypothetical protein
MVEFETVFFVSKLTENYRANRFQDLLKTPFEQSNNG